MSGCLSAPDYSITPRIEPNSVKVMLKNDRYGKRDSIEIAINFQDGDGDLGLSSTDTADPYDYRNGTNRYYENYFIQPYYKNKSGVFVPLVSTITANGRYPRLTEVGARPGPIKGVLRRALVFRCSMLPKAPSLVLNIISGSVLLTVPCTKAM